MRGSAARRWGVLQAISNVAWPVVAYASIWRHTVGTGLEPLAQGVLGFSFLPLIFVALMQIVALSELELTVRSLQLGLLTPVAVVALTLPWRPADAAWFAFEVGALYLSALMLAFAYPFVALALLPDRPSSARFVPITTIVQCMFGLPSLIAASAWITWLPFRRSALGCAVYGVSVVVLVSRGWVLG